MESKSHRIKRLKRSSTQWWLIGRGMGPFLYAWPNDFVNEHNRRVEIAILTRQPWGYFLPGDFCGGPGKLEGAI